MTARQPPALSIGSPNSLVGIIHAGIGLPSQGFKEQSVRGRPSTSFRPCAAE
jgi:hypothetical protein